MQHKGRAKTPCVGLEKSSLFTVCGRTSKWSWEGFVRCSDGHSDEDARRRAVRVSMAWRGGKAFKDGLHFVLVAGRGKAATDSIRREHKMVIVSDKDTIRKENHLEIPILQECSIKYFSVI